MDFSEINPDFLSSRSNPTVIRLSKLSEKKYRTEFCLFLCEGEKLAKEALAFAKIDTILISDSVYRSQNLSAKEIFCAAVGAGAKPFVLSDEAFAKISTEQAPQGIIAVVRCDSIRMLVSGADCDRAMMLDSVRDPGNLGTIMRSAAAFGVKHLLLHDCADIYNPKTIRASMGAVFKLSFCMVDDAVKTVEELKKSGRNVYAAALSDNSIELGNCSLLPSDIVIIGNEGHGISDDIVACCSATLKIPMVPDTESLNASVAASVILWEQFKNS